MRIIAILSVLILLFAGSFTFTACKSGPKNFCDTACNNDTLRYSIDHPAKPYIAIAMKNCMPDTVIWSHSLLSTKRKVTFTTLANKEVKINSKFIHFYIKDTSYVWVLFNECINGQGFALKLPFDKNATAIRKNSAFNYFDPKFIIPENVAAYTDKGNIFIEDMVTGKKATMTFGQQLNIDYTNIHETVDSVIITPTHVRARVNIENSWKIIEKDITLQ
jgi:hypothetical protein